MSSAMAADAIHDAKDVFDKPKRGVWNDIVVAYYTRSFDRVLAKHIENHDHQNYFLCGTHVDPIWNKAGDT